MKLLLNVLLSMILVSPMMVSAKNIVIWMGSSPGGFQSRYFAMLKHHIEQNSEYKVTPKYQPGDGGLTSIRTYVETNKNHRDTDIHLLLQNDKVLITEFLRPDKLSPEIMRQLKPLVSLGETGVVMHVPSSLSVKNINDLDQLGLNSISFGSLGPGSFANLIETLIASHIKTPVNNVRYTNTPSLIKDIAGGHITAGIGWPDSIATSKQGLTNIIAVSKPLKDLPGVKTFSQQGITGVPESTFWALFVIDQSEHLHSQALRELFTKLLNNQDFLSEWEDKTSLENPLSNSLIVDQWWNSQKIFYKNLSTDPRLSVLGN